MTQNISFKSTFRPATRLEFSKVASRIPEKCFVDFPWTINESVKAASAKTNMVFDCSMLGITDGQEVFMLHLCPTIKENLDFNKIKDFILKKIKINNPNLQAVLIGSQRIQDNSSRLNNFLYNLTKEWNIPCSVFKTNKDPVNIAYFSETDEWIISSYEIEKSLLRNNLSSKNIFKKEFENVQLSNLDEFA